MTITSLSIDLFIQRRPLPRPYTRSDMANIHRGTSRGLSEDTRARSSTHPSLRLRRLFYSAPEHKFGARDSQSPPLFLGVSYSHCGTEKEGIINILSSDTLKQ